jgi:hypothetical protein
LTFILSIAAVARARPVQDGEQAEVQAHPAEARLQSAWKEGKFAIVFARRPADLESERMAKRLDAVIPSLDVQVERVTLNMAQDSDRAYADSWHVHSAPLALVLAPGGTVTGHFSTPEQVEQLADAIVPPPVVDILQAFQDQKVVLLLAHAESGGGEALAARARSVCTLLPKCLALVEVQPDAKGAQRVFQPIRFDPGTDPATLFVVSPRGQLVSRLSGQVSTKKLLHAFQSVLVGKSGCGSMGRGPRATCE